MEQELRRGWQIHQQQSFAEAEQIYRRALASSPRSADAWCYLGIVLHDQKRYTEAVEAYQRALELKPEFAIALNNLGNTLRYTGEIEEADKCFQRAIDLRPNYVNAYKNRGTLHVWTGSLELGLEYYRRALQLNPDDAELHRNLGVIYLLQGRFEEGWQEYRWRWRTGDLHRPFSHLPIWSGEDLQGKSIVLTAEQGLGDTIHFVRFTRQLRQRGAKTLVYCQPSLLALLQSSRDLVGEVFPNNLPLLQAVDYQSSLLDVADVLQVDETNIPSELPYLRAAENLLAYWRPRVAPNQSTFRVGICWQGNPDHQADSFRSLPLKQFERISDIPGVELFSLQSGYGSEQISQWQAALPLRLPGTGIDQSSGGFMDTAAIVQHLDLVVTSDTSVAHLAGALNVPTWIVLGLIPDWRWLLDREDSPWYRSVRLFRQSRLGDWSEVMGRVCGCLGEQVRQKLAN